VGVPTIRTVTPLLETPLLTLGEFRCPPGDDAWREMNTIGDTPHIVFPRTNVFIEQEGRTPVLATPAHAMLYDAGQLYRRGLRTEVGDDAVFVTLPVASLEQLAEEGASLVGADNRMAAGHTPAGRRTYLLQHLLVRYLRERDPDPLLAEEAAGRLVLEALGSARAERRRRPRAERAHRALAEAAKAELAENPERPYTLPQLAGRLHSSAFHLARVFRAETGFSLHGFRRTLRLRAGLERLSADGNDLTALALELGFSSHSHFSERFRNEFGVPPSLVRNARQTRALLEAAVRS
jgi:AraC family transcriptional regulator